MRLPDWFVGGVSEPAWDLYEGSPRLRTYRRLRRRQFDPVEALEERRRKRLNALVRHAASASPFYEDRFRRAGITPAGVWSIAEIRGLPLLTKSDVRGHLREILAANIPPGDLVPAKTGGSTGVPLQVYCDRRGFGMRQGAALLADSWSGWRLGEPMAAVWGNPPVIATWRERLRRLAKDRFIYLDTMRLTEAAVREFVREWRALRPTLLFGHAHSLFLLARMLEESGESLSPRGIVTTSMMLLLPERRVIEKVFARPVTNRYGCEEVSLIACECERHQGLHINAEHIALEILRDDGTPAVPGEEGRIVVTELVNFGMPMIRYEIGDRGTLDERACACGRACPLLKAVTGRTADFLLAADGARVAGISLIENTLTRFAGIAQLQVVQTEMDCVELNVVRAPDWSEDVAAGLTQVFRSALGGNLKVDLRFCQSIPQEPSGKYRFSICRVPGGGWGA